MNKHVAGILAVILTVVIMAISVIVITKLMHGIDSMWESTKLEVANNYIDDYVSKSNIAFRNHNYLDACVNMGIAADAALNDKNEKLYVTLSDQEKTLCSLHRLSLN